jgi:hypothetical protein
MPLLMLLLLAATGACVTARDVDPPARSSRVQATLLYCEYDAPEPSIRATRMFQYYSSCVASEVERDATLAEDCRCLAACTAIDGDVAAVRCGNRSCAELLPTCEERDG